MASTSTGSRFEVTRRELFEIWRNSNKKSRVNKLLDYVLLVLNVNSVNSEINSAVKTFVTQLGYQFQKKWLAKGRRSDTFQNTYGIWLNERIEFPAKLLNLLSHFGNTPIQPAQVGRPPKQFQDCATRTKRMKIKPILDTYHSEELVYAASVSVRASGKKQAANLIEEIGLASPRRSIRYKKAMRIISTPKKAQPYSPEEALNLFMRNNLTVHQYKTMQSEATERGYNIYPSYYKISRAKKACYPQMDTITITDISVEVQLQSLLDHTATRLCKYLEDVIMTFPDENLALLCKWGLDGSSGHSLYKQCFENTDSSDEYLISISFVPLRLHVQGEYNKIVWQNPRPGSTRFCRPIKLLFKQETEQLILEETGKINKEIETLSKCQIKLKNKIVNIGYQMALTMVDTKVCNAMTATKSAQRCFICGMTPKQMNKTKQNKPNERHYSFGISSLHAWIRCLETMLHISYRLDLKEWQIRKEEKKQQLAYRKKEILKKFKEEIGLILDKPKPGAGNTNDGNSARRFFKDAERTSGITGLNKELLERLDILLRAISSGYEINIEAFDKFSKETRELYLKNYEWYPMPVTMHKLFFHASEIIKTSILPIGQMSEEAQEARNKEIRRVREGHTRKNSRVATNLDMFLYLMAFSDPLISNITKLPRKSSSYLPRQVLNLLKMPEI